MGKRSLFAAWVAALVGVSAALASDTPARATYSDVQAFLRRLVANHPNTTQLVEVGASDSGRMIEGVKIGNGPVNDLLVATHHGNEYGATEVARAVATSVAEHPLRGRTLFVIPVLNISGYDQRHRGEDRRLTQYDPNRDYPGPCGTDGPFELKSTAALAAFIERNDIVAAATLHTYHPVVAYPWGFGTPNYDPPNLDLFQLLVRAATIESGYPTGNSTAMIYPAPGTFEDYAFWRYGIWAVLFELGSSHTPDDRQVDDLVAVNVPGLRRLFESAPTVRAAEHEFRGTCDPEQGLLDRHDE